MAGNMAAGSRTAKAAAANRLWRIGNPVLVFGAWMRLI
jgi:hypothetical protein